MTRKCHVRICRRARRHNEGLSLTHPQYYHPVSICFGLAFCKYRSGVRCFWQPTSKRVLQRRTAGSAADHESIQRARTTRRRNCLNFCSFCFEETTTWPIVATPFLPSGEKLIGAQRAAPLSSRRFYLLFRRNKRDERGSSAALRAQLEPIGFCELVGQILVITQTKRNLVLKPGRKG